MGITQILKEREADVIGSIKTLKAELVDIKTAIGAIDVSHGSTPHVHKRLRLPPVKAQSMTIDKAVIEAVTNGRKAPMAVLDFIKNELGIETTINSVRTRLSKLKNEGIIARDDSGWIMPNEIKGYTPNENEPPIGGSDTEEATTSSKDSHQGLVDLLG